MVETGCEPVNVQTDHQPALAAGGPQGWGLGACGNLGASGGPSRLHPTCRLGSSVLRSLPSRGRRGGCRPDRGRSGPGRLARRGPRSNPGEPANAQIPTTFTHAPPCETDPPVTTGVIATALCLRRRSLGTVGTYYADPLSLPN